MTIYHATFFSPSSSQHLENNTPSLAELYEKQIALRIQGLQGKRFLYSLRVHQVNLICEELMQDCYKQKKE